MFLFQNRPSCRQHPSKHPELSVLHPGTARAAPLASASRDRSFSRGCVSAACERLPRRGTMPWHCVAQDHGSHHLPSRGDFAAGHSCNLSPFLRPTSPGPRVNGQEPSHWERRDWRGLQEYSEHRKSKISRKSLLLWKTRCLNTDLLPCCRLPAGRLSSG